MDKNHSHSPQCLCRLCLATSSNFLNILNEKIDDKTIASVLSQHFWFDFEMKEDDPNKDICENCWMKVKDFHLFYTKVYNIHELLSKVEHDIKLEIGDTEVQTEKALGLEQNTAFKTEYDIILENFQVDGPDPLLSELEDDKWSDQCSNTANDLNDSTNTNISNDESVLLTPKRLVVKPNSRETRKTKKLKTVTKNEINPSEQAKMERQNKQISENFSMDCELCSLKLDSFRMLQIHYRKEHKIKGYVRCCNRKHSKRYNILEHLQHHLNPERFKCEICNKYFLTKRYLDLHLRNHMPSEERPFKCTECPKTFVIANLLKRHLETHGTERKFICNECGKSHLTKKQLQSHQRSIHNEANYICDVCAKPLRSKSTFEKHHLSVHGKVPLAKMQCTFCGSWLTNKYYLKSHIKRHSESKMSFACSICGKAAPNSKALQSHMRIVHTDKIYECNLCNKTFKRSISLKEHLASHTGDRLYSCPYCTKTFNSSANMYSHRKKNHLKEWENQKLEKQQTNASTK